MFSGRLHVFDTGPQPSSATAFSRCFEPPALTASFRALPAWMTYPGSWYYFCRHLPFRPATTTWERSRQERTVTSSSLLPALVSTGAAPYWCHSCQPVTMPASFSCRQLSGLSVYRGMRVTLGYLTYCDTADGFIRFCAAQLSGRDPQGLL